MTKAIYTLVGMKHRGSTEFVAGMPTGEPCVLRRDPTNPHDPNAVEVHARGYHVGFVKATEARRLAAAMDRAKQPERSGKIVVSADRWPCVEIEE